MTASASVQKISFVIPVFNEQDNLQPLTEELEAVAAQLQCPYEIWFVDDGSTDASLATIRNLAKTVAPPSPPDSPPRPAISLSPLMPISRTIRLISRKC